ncbi:translation initiation factor IF-2 subunit beta [Candidatus Pacearchaeota archaeon CG_4_9_14_3_um_filter_31_7]|nr:MAG: translation initiation factor IF-2 subunit beta [Candidatus Pacearchaeota archaeon CG1_02_31_27]PIN92016.1 MAG: translation initiation factor IF-2 subunit beta [Candidatus Pacearchaeota archaeon CG10_big_fil_rev_8_21_14_0_10_31_59]PIZ81100.1 MAG: translation initiation factor IF-2 subunit beta [Candidatus Pacearchaeota archaeon CG_4_10_14_0_2_um_filter_31_10]PJA70687.1 MAG: translation initiation factor IF-2 subunit beta [Candidatus Pacearchaeota archaeon CG_4_9_14_3_um_filter_31_7]
MTDKNYEESLEKLYKEVKPVETAKDRFEVPKVEGHFEGNKTIITNFNAIVSYLRRDPEHIRKYLLKELATPAVLEANRIVLNRKISSAMINKKIEDYTKEFVLCKECGKPDSELVKEGPYLFLHCLACGAKHSVRARIV